MGILTLRRSRVPYFLEAYADFFCLATIPFVLENTALLAALIHPNHIVYLCSWDSRACRLTVIPITLGIALTVEK